MKRKDPGLSDQSAEPDQGGDDFLQRWSRRKAQAGEETPPPVPSAAPVEAAPAPNEEPQAPPLTDADMPPVDSITEESDVSGFFSPGVSDKLRRMALRKVFSLSIYNVRDGLDDYDEDFTFFEPLGDTVTADMRHRQEREEQKRREREALEQQQAEGEVEEITDDENGQLNTHAEADADDSQETAPHESHNGAAQTERANEDDKPRDT